MSKKKYIPIICPVCNEFYFSPLTDEDLKDGDDGFSRYCYVCGWKYNIEQIIDSNIKDIDGYNILELKSIFNNKRKANKRYNYQESTAPKQKKHLCPVCQRYYFPNVDDHNICPICKWENDMYGEEHPDSDGGANSISLNDSIKIWLGKAK